VVITTDEDHLFGERRPEELVTEDAAASYNDVAGGVRLDRCFYHVILLDEGWHELSNQEFHDQYVARSLRALSSMFEELLSEASNVKMVTRRPSLPLFALSGVVTVDEVSLRWLIDYDAATTRDRLVLDVFVGTQVLQQVGENK
jgi:hypothetical protein